MDRDAFGYRLVMIERPVELEDALSGLSYPASKAEMLRQAVRNGADEHLLRALHRLPDRLYETSEDVSRGIRQAV
jgi:hypothetical protein